MPNSVKKDILKAWLHEMIDDFFNRPDNPVVYERLMATLATISQLAEYGVFSPDTASDFSEVLQALLETHASELNGCGEQGDASKQEIIMLCRRFRRLANMN